MVVSETTYPLGNAYVFSTHVDFREGICPYRKNFTQNLTGGKFDERMPDLETLIFLFHVKASGVDIFIEVPH